MSKEGGSYFAPFTGISSRTPGSASGLAASEASFGSAETPSAASDAALSAASGAALSTAGLAASISGLSVEGASAFFSSAHPDIEMIKTATMAYIHPRLRIFINFSIIISHYSIFGFVMYPLLCKKEGGGTTIDIDKITFVKVSTFGDIHISDESSLQLALWSEAFEDKMAYAIFVDS